ESTSHLPAGRITASLGVASFPLQAETRDQLVAAADRALYSAKRAGRNCVCAAPVDTAQESAGVATEREACDGATSDAPSDSGHSGVSTPRD
ncbi:MAG: diguanylate cyclase, partial [Pyrinomonadaceae bacterium]